MKNIGQKMIIVNSKSSLDALDKLYRPDRPRVVGGVLNNSFQKGKFLKKVMSPDFGLLKLSNIYLLSLFWNDFYTIPTRENPTKTYSSKLSGKVEI